MNVYVHECFLMNVSIVAFGSSETPTMMSPLSLFA